MCAQSASRSPCFTAHLKTLKGYSEKDPQVNAIIARLELVLANIKAEGEKAAAEGGERLKDTKGAKAAHQAGNRSQARLTACMRQETFTPCLM